MTADLYIPTPEGPLMDDGEPLQAAIIAGQTTIYLRTGSDNWTRTNDQLLRLYLKSCGLNGNKEKGELVSEVDAAIKHIIKNNTVTAAVPLAGYKAGVHVTKDGARFLSLNTLRPMAGCEGEWPTLRRFFVDLFGEEVLQHHMGWWHWARKSLQGDSILPGQCMVYIGESGAGKSYLQAKITTAILGGRTADPFQYMTGQTTFNSHLFACEHLAIEDQFVDLSTKGRRAFGAKLKELAVNHVQNCHGKGMPAVTLSPKWRVSMSMNPDGDNLDVLPPLDASFLDKVMLIKCAKGAFFENYLKQPDGWRKWDEMLTRELPALVHDIDNYEIPPHLIHDRYGVKAWHDPTLLEAEHEVSEEQQVYDLLMRHLPRLCMDICSSPWEGTAGALRDMLTGREVPSNDLTKRLFFNDTRTGRLLARMAKTHPDAITRLPTKINGCSRWSINFPEETTA